MKKSANNESNDNAVKSSKKQWLWFIALMILGLGFTLFLAQIVKYFFIWLN